MIITLFYIQRGLGTRSAAEAHGLVLVWTMPAFQQEVISLRKILVLGLDMCNGALWYDMLNVRMINGETKAGFDRLYCRA